MQNNVPRVFGQQFGAVVGGAALGGTVGLYLLKEVKGRPKQPRSKITHNFGMRMQNVRFTDPLPSHKLVFALA